MPISREGEFLLTHTMGDVTHIGLETGQLDACIADARLSSYKGVFGSPIFGFKEQDLDALHQLPELESIWFWEVHLKNVDAIYSLKSLRHFGVHPRRPAIDFSRLPQLESLTVHPRARDSGLSSLHALRSLQIWHYSAKTFEALALPSGLSSLQINWASSNNLDGLSPLPQLKRLEIHRCRNLESLSGIDRLFPALQHLVVAACGRLDSQQERAAVLRLKSLQHAYVQDAKIV